MSNRTPEEIQAQREAWLARKAARAAGQDVPAEVPAVSAEPEPVIVETAPEALPAVEVTPQPVVEMAAAAPVSAAPPQSPESKRSPDEVRAQREAFLAAKAAKAAGLAAPPPAPAPKPVEAAAPAPKPVEAPKAAPKPTAAATAPKPTPAKEAVPEKIDPVVTRREFLNYAWLASIALLTVQGVGLSLWFAFPNFKEGQFGGAFPIGEATGALPEVNAGPKAYVDGKFWLVNLDTEVNGEARKGIMAIYKVCTHLGCLYEWIPMTNRFECPCHGSKFQLSGDYIEGPTRRSLDSFVIQAIAPDGSIKETDLDGSPLVINGDETLVIDTGRRILGAPVLIPA